MNHTTVPNVRIGELEEAVDIVAMISWLQRS